MFVTTAPGSTSPTVRELTAHVGASFLQSYYRNTEIEVTENTETGMELKYSEQFKIQVLQPNELNYGGKLLQNTCLCSVV